MKAVILCNGEPPPRGLFERTCLQAELFIACDGAAQIALSSYDRMADIIIGDLDSLSPHLIKLPNVRYVHDQNSNDLEKALNLALELGVREVSIMGASGLRFDHFLCNLYILPRFVEHIKIKLVDAYGEAWIAAPDEELTAPINTPLSLFALGQKPVTNLSLEGLKYILKNATLEPNNPKASLNLFAEERARITHESGILLLYAALRSQI